MRRPAHLPLEGEVRADVAVVGGGLAGLSAALELAQRGRSVVVLEGQRLGWAASGRNGGQALPGLACDMAEIEAQLGLGDARRIWAMTIEALTLIHARRDRHRIACDWQSGALTVAVNARKAAALQAWVNRMAEVYDDHQQWLDPTALPLHIRSARYAGGVYDRRSGHLHPLKYVLGLAHAAWQAGATVHEHTAVTGIERHRNVTLLRTAQGQVLADQVLLAGNVHLAGLPGLPATPAARTMPVGTYVAVTEPLAPAQMDALLPTRAAVCDNNFSLDHFRPTADQRLLYGGKVSYSTVTPPNLAARMRVHIVRTFPSLAHTPITHAWGGFIDITRNRAPEFVRLPADGAAGAPIYLVQGFSGHGLALTGLAGKLVAEAMCGDAGRFDVFSRLRHRPFPGGERLRTPTLVLGMLWHRLRDLL
ncbi:NAD(P)/FAD-dependent oxidoreductase [Sphaerotilus sp.]|uniref:NAD(P)/FAD-dependent oxidoreductase n=1 Tax=Sphaerotilus sp. TaxID=2093942 RepID=UPI0034E206D0